MKKLSTRLSFALTLVSFLILTGCIQLQNQNDPFQAPITEDPEYFSQRLKSSTTKVEEIEYRLLFIRSLMNKDKLIEARKELNNVSSTYLTGIRAIEYKLLQAELDYRDKKYDLASLHLANIDIKKLNDNQKHRYFDTKIAIAESRNRQDDVFLSYLEWQRESSSKNHKMIVSETWKELNSYSPEALKNLAKLPEMKGRTGQGWLELRQISETQVASKEEFDKRLTKWKRTYSSHPARYLADELVQQSAENQTQNMDFNIAILLPVSGPAQPFGNAIYSGFKQAMYDTSIDGKVNLMLYDMNKVPFSELLQSVKKQKNNIVVGPLIKEEILTLQETSLSLPVLALNRVNEADKKSNYCYFGLAPEDEAISAAKRMYQKNKNVLLIVPQSEIGGRIENAFSDEWKKLAKNTNNLTTLLFDPRDPSSLNLDLVKQKTDAIYLFVTDGEMKQIRPIIDNAAKRLSKYPALYSSSRVTNLNNEVNPYLEGIELTEIPFITESNSAAEISKLPNSIKNDLALIRLYAMGKDTWNLVLNYQNLNSRFNAKGNTGSFNVDKDCQIIREFTWQKYINGKIKTIQ